MVSRALKTVPYPLLGENTLVVSDSLCVSWTRGGALELVARVGDTYPNQMVEVVVHFILYRWCRLEDQQRDPLLPTFTQHRLDVSYVGLGGLISWRKGRRWVVLGTRTGGRL